MVSVPAAASKPNSYPAEEAVLVIVAAIGFAATQIWSAIIGQIRAGG